MIAADAAQKDYHRAIRVMGAKWALEAIIIVVDSFTTNLHSYTVDETEVS